MLKAVLAANWKSNMTLAEMTDWVNGFRRTMETQNQLDFPQATIIVCAPFTLLLPLKEKIAGLALPIAVGAQDVSPFGSGAYTGEVNAAQIKEFADWVIIGHSERRQNFGEADEMLRQKVEQARSAGLKVIYCVQDETQPVPDGVEVVAYEPPGAIGTGRPDTPENANNVAQVIRQKFSQVTQVVYGGSVKPENVRAFVAQEFINGVLVGGASLTPDSWFNLVVAANS
ncbi:MAG: triose-phosphate isomerase [Patescibacteria group bacterium]